MLTWIQSNLASIIVVAVVLVLLALALRKVIADKKSGKGCPYGGSGSKGGCHLR